MTIDKLKAAVQLGNTIAQQKEEEIRKEKQLEQERQKNKYLDELNWYKEKLGNGDTLYTMITEAVAKKETFIWLGSCENTKELLGCAANICPALTDALQQFEGVDASGKYYQVKYCDDCGYESVYKITITWNLK